MVGIVLFSMFLKKYSKEPSQYSEYTECKEQPDFLFMPQCINSSSYAFLHLINAYDHAFGKYTIS